MGCDIHMHIEVKQADGSWKRHDWLAKYSDGTYEDGSRRVKWGDSFPWFLSKFIPACEKLGDEVRLVFWFDN